MAKKMRLHQQELKRRATEIAEGKVTADKTVAHITPGGGKSIAAAVFSRELLSAGKIKRVAWITPRTSLARQAAEGFKDPEFNPFYRARHADNVLPLWREPSLGEICYTTTYQSVVSRPDLHLKELRQHKYLIILDEPHHLKLVDDGDEEADPDEDDGTWVNAINPIVENATHTLLMTGTIERHDKKLVPFIDYEEDGGKLFPHKDIFYSRFDALMEEAVVRINFTFANGWAEYEDDDGKHKVEISNATEKEVSKVIRTFLSKTEFRDRLLHTGMTHWLETRKRYPSRAIVICAGQKMAKAVAEQIKKTYKVEVALAVSEDGIEAQRAIRAFRRKEYGQVLVTVGMAYEGLDVPDCKHLICLTDYRSTPWLEQAFARVTRVDYAAMAAGLSYEDQKAYIFVPDDPRMKRTVTYLEDEQDRGVKPKAPSQEQLEEEDEEEEKDNAKVGAIFNVLGATTTNVSTGVLDETVIVDDSVVESVPVTLHEDERDLRKRIEMLTRRRDLMRRLPPGSTNKHLLERFGKSRSKMGSEELKKVLTYLTSSVKS